jgi:hypothetical protein
MYARERQQRQQGNFSGLIGGAILVTLGAAFLLRQTFDIDIVGLSWPLFIIIPGLALLAAALFGGRGAGHLAIPGSVVTTIGAILLFQNTFDYYESWAYVWALIPTASGVGMVIAGLREGKPKEMRAGVETASGGLTMFLIFGAFFELFIFRGAAVVVFAWPVALIAVGALLLLRGRLGRQAADEPWQDDDQPESRPQGDGPVFPY